jgi:TPR repeat protein
MKMKILVLAGLVALAKGAYAADFDDAMAAYERGDYVGAQAAFLAAARRGDAQAQEIVGFMYAFGPQLYAGTTRDMEAARGWFEQAGRKGRPVARYMYCTLSRSVSASAALTTDCAGLFERRGK